MSFDNGQPIKKFTSQECLDALIKAITEDPTLVRNHIHLYTADQVNDFGLNLWPSVLDPSAWERTATRRPKKDNDSNSTSALGGKWCGTGTIGMGFPGGTDREIRIYENEVWTDAGKTLEGIVTTEMGEVISVEVRVLW